MKSFKDMINESDIEETFTREDLIELIYELDEDELEDVQEYILELVAFNQGYDWDDLEEYEWDYDLLDDDEDELTEKMSTAAKKKAARKRKLPAFKKAMRLKKRCQEKHKETIKKSNGKKVCNVKGKLVKGMSMQDRRKLAKSRKKLKNKITIR